MSLVVYDLACRNIGSPVVSIAGMKRLPSHVIASPSETTSEYPVIQRFRQEWQYKTRSASCRLIVKVGGHEQILEAVTRGEAAVGGSRPTQHEVLPPVTRVRTTARRSLDREGTFRSLNPLAVDRLTTGWDEKSGVTGAVSRNSRAGAVIEC